MIRSSVCNFAVGIKIALSAMQNVIAKRRPVECRCVYAGSMMQIVTQSGLL